MLMPSTAKILLWRVHPPLKASVMGLFLTLRSSTNPDHMPADAGGAVLSDDKFGGVPQKQMLVEASLRHKVRSSGATWSLRHTSVTSSGTTGSSKTTDWDLITRTCAFEHCLHTRGEVKGYDVSESRSPYTDIPPVQSEQS